MKIKSKQIVVVVVQMVLTLVALPVAFLVMLVFDIEMNSKFISAADGSVAPGFYAYLKILGCFLLVIWLSYPVFKLMTKYLEKKKNQ